MAKGHSGLHWTTAEFSMVNWRSKGAARTTLEYIPGSNGIIERAEALVISTDSFLMGCVRWPSHFSLHFDASSDVGYGLSPINLVPLRMGG